MMGAGDIRVSVEQTEARIIGHESHGHGFPAGNSQRAWNRIERCTGIEPASPVWKTGGTDRCANTANRNPQTPYQKADSLADATGFEPGSPPTGGGVLPLHQRPARVMNSVRSLSRDPSGWRPAMDSVARITRSVFA